MISQSILIQHGYLSIHLDSTRSNPFDIQLDILPLGIMIFTKMNLNPFLGILSILSSYSHAFYISCHITSNSLELVHANFSHVAIIFNTLDEDKQLLTQATFCARKNKGMLKFFLKFKYGH